MPLQRHRLHAGADSSALKVSTTRDANANANYRVAPQARLPSQAAKHLKLAPSGAQSASSVHGRAQELASEAHPASVKEPSARQDRPAPHW